jgi:hypothetical protein
MPTPPSTPIVRFGKDTTIRWKCEAGDFVIWVPCSPFEGDGNEFKIGDIWEMRDGDVVTISDRPEDFPTWFQLAPSEVSGSLARKMVAQLNSGEIEASEPVETANVWRLPAGARLVWVGAKRPDYSTFEGTHGVLQLLEFCENALVVGEPAIMEWDTLSVFGALSKSSPSTEDRAMILSAKKWVRQLGIPRVMAVEWSIG